MANVIEQAAQAIRRRLAQLEGLVTEHQQLKRTLDALEGLTEVGTGTTAPQARDESGSRGAPIRDGRRRPGGRQRSGLSRAEQFVGLVSERPGSTVAEAAERLNVSRQTLYNLTGRLQREGRLRKEGRRFYPAFEAPQGASRQRSRESFSEQSPDATR
jgi:hypothetical protein